MPAAIPIVAAAAAAFTSITIGGFVGALAGLAVAGAISFVGGRLFPVKPPSAASFAFDAAGILVQTNSPIEAHKIIYGQIRCSGNSSLKTTTNSGTTYSGGTREGSNPFFHQIICFAGHEIEEFTTVYFADQEVTLDGSGWVTSAPYFKDGVSYARVLKHLGGASQVADTLAVSQITGWDSSCVGSGIAYLYIILEFNADIYTAGIPNITALIKGKKVYDPRSDTTAWSANPVLCIRDYLTSDYGFNVPSARINDTLAIANANVCDEDVDLQAGGTQNRYECHGFLSTDRSPLDNLQQLTSSVAAPITYVQGMFCINVAIYDSPALEITDDMIIGEITVNPRASRKELFNAVQGTFADPQKNYQPTSFPIVTNATYEAQDGGERILRDLQLPFEKSAERAQRIAKILLEKSRQGITVDFALDPSSPLEFSVWDTFTHTNSAFGWEDKVFRVMSWRFDPGKGIAISAQEESSASYDWNEGEATIIDAAPDTNLPDPFTVQPPGSPMITETLYSTIGSAGIKTKALVSWVASTDAFAREYQLEYKLAADTDYIVIPRTPDTRYTIFDIQPGSYNFRVKAVNTLGITSAYSTAIIQIFGLTALPQNVTNFSLNAINNNAHLTWDSADSSVDLDVLVGGNVRIRYSPDITGSATWSTAIDIAPELSGIATSAVVPLLTGTYFAKFVDSSGNESATAAEIISTVADIVKMNIVATLTEDPGFTGAKTNMSVSGGVLSLDPDGSVFETHGIYESSTYVDVGRVTTSRVSFSIAATTFNSVDLFDSRSGDFDDASGYFDGEDVSGMAFKMFISTTDDDPSGTPTWSAFRQFFVGDYTARAFKFKLDVLSEDSSYQTQISALAFQVDCPDVVDRGALSTASGSLTTVSFNKPFVITTPFVGATILDADLGDRIFITNVSSTSFDIGVKNTAGSYVVKTVNWDAKGH